MPRLLIADVNKKAESNTEEISGVNEKVESNTKEISVVNEKVEANAEDIQQMIEHSEVVIGHLNRHKVQIDLITHEIDHLRKTLADFRKVVYAASGIVAGVLVAYLVLGVL